MNNNFQPPKDNLLILFFIVVVLLLILYIYLTDVIKYRDYAYGAMIFILSGITFAYSARVYLRDSWLLNKYHLGPLRQSKYERIAFLASISTLISSGILLYLTWPW